MLKLYKTIIKGNIGQNVNIYVDFSKLDNFLITIITYLFSFFYFTFFTSLTFKTLPLEEARTNTKWCWIHYFLFTSFEKMGFGVSILFFQKGGLLYCGNLFLFSLTKKKEGNISWFGFGILFSVVAAFTLRLK